eukprot:Awhi_evm2s7537
MKINRQRSSRATIAVVTMTVCSPCLALPTHDLNTINPLQVAGLEVTSRGSQASATETSNQEYPWNNLYLDMLFENKESNYSKFGDVYVQVNVKDLTSIANYNSHWDSPNSIGKHLVPKQVSKGDMGLELTYFYKNCPHPSGCVQQIDYIFTAPLTGESCTATTSIQTPQNALDTWSVSWPNGDYPNGGYTGSPDLCSHLRQDGSFPKGRRTVIKTNERPGPNGSGHWFTSFYLKEKNE